MAKDIEPKLKLIGEYLKLSKNEYFVIPEYQREYSWNIIQCDKLWQDIESFMEAEATDPYFFGTIIMDCSTTGVFNLIDGQQRTTTFLLLLKALQIRLEEVIKDFKSDKESESLLKGLIRKRDKILTILFKCDDELLDKVIEDWAVVKGIKIIENNSINEQHKHEIRTIFEARDFGEAENVVYKFPKKKKDNKYTNYFRNFMFFYNRLKEYKESGLNTFSDTILTKCQIIEIRSWQIEQAITMFNSLNSTGLPLSDANIISAQLYSNADKKEDFNKRWESINRLASELSSRKIIDIDAVLQQFMYINRAINKEYINNGSTDVTTPGLRNYYMNIRKELLESPFELCDNFSKITLIWDAIKEYPIIKLLLKFNENAKLYLIAYLFRIGIDNASEANVFDISECLIRLFALLELVDSGYSSKNFKTFLFTEDIKFVDHAISIDEIKKDFDCHIQKTWNEADISQAILEYDKNILVFLNEYIYTKEKGVNFNFSESVNIEHIMPASGHNLDAIRQDAKIDSVEEFDTIANKLGNKILLEENINKSIGNEWFKTKKQKSVMDKSGYKDSKYNIAHALIDYPADIWTKEDIEKANQKNADRISKFIFNS